MKLFLLLLTPLITAGSFAAGYGVKYWDDNVTTQTALNVSFDEAAKDAIKRFAPIAISTNDLGQIEVGTLCVTEPCGRVYPIAQADLPPEMVAVTRSQWGGMVYVASALQKTNPDLYNEAYNTGSTYPIGHIEGDGSFSIDW